MTVRVDRNGAFEGSGFLIAPQTVLTCAHVVDEDANMEVRWLDADDNEHVSKATRVRKLTDDPDDPYPPLVGYPDTALLSVDLPEHPCARLAYTTLSFDQAPVRARPYTDELVKPQRSSFSGRTDGILGRYQQALYKLADGQVVDGMSGAGLATTADSATFGVIAATRDRNTALGGYAIALYGIAHEREIVAILDLNSAYFASTGAPYIDPTRHPVHWLAAKLRPKCLPRASLSRHDQPDDV